MKAFDRVITGVIVFLAGLVFLHAAAIIFHKMASAQLEESAQIPTQSKAPTTRKGDIQGTGITWPGEASVVTYPVVLEDGSLDPEHRFLPQKTGHLIPDPSAPKLSYFGPPIKIARLIRGPSYQPYYQQRRTMSMPKFGPDCWLFSRDFGFAYINDQSQVGGWLTDQGWSATRQSCDSLRRTLAGC